MVLAYLGHTVSESALNRLFEAEDFGVPGHRLRRLAQGGYRVRYESGTETMLRSLLNDPWFDVAPQAVPRNAFLAAWVEMDCLSGAIEA